MSIEISVLSELLAIPQVGAGSRDHGVVVCVGTGAALLLPQVATERGWSIERFLEETCRKADLDARRLARSGNADIELYGRGLFRSGFSSARALQAPRVGNLIAVMKKWGSV